MNRLDERTKGYYGIKLDGAKLAAIANQIYALQYTDAVNCNVEDLLLIELTEKDVFGRSRYAVVCSEGVGFEQDDFGTISVPTNIGEYGYANGRVHISANVIKQCVTDELVDIALYVRVFGDRLDRNVYIWQSAMEKHPTSLTIYLQTKQEA